jgi:tryptophanyl-tRNA synthetase
VEFQKKNEGVIMIVDYHAMDTETNPQTLHDNILTLAATYLAAGIDVKKNILFQQSDVSEHTELAWIFSTIVRMSELERMTQYKDKALVRNENVPVALFSYPLLMAADILLYEPSAVPVGQDQKQHVELARDIAERFNKIYGETFSLPKPVLREVGAKIMSLNEPSKKMSKSSANQKGCVMITDAPETIRKKIMSAVTDDMGAISYSDEQPGVKNLIDIYSLAGGRSVNEIVKSYVGRGYGELKKDTAEALIEFLKPLQKGVIEYLKDRELLKGILAEGADRAREIAAGKMKAIKTKIGVKL